LDELPSTAPLPTLRTRMANERALGVSFISAVQTWRQLAAVAEPARGCGRILIKSPELALYRSPRALALTHLFIWFSRPQSGMPIIPESQVYAS
jgi:hypothetical protein